jgi:hypothetical protein
VNAALAPIAARNLRQFLMSRDWEEGQGSDRFLALIPPSTLELPTGYSLVLPHSVEGTDGARFIDRVVDTVSEIYGKTRAQLEPVLMQADSVLALALDDDHTANGTIELQRFESLVEKLRRLLLHSAAFVVKEDPVVDHVPIEAQLYLDRCRFLQTAVGSFVANVQLPANREIGFDSRIEPMRVQASAVTDRVSDLIGVVTSTILNQDMRVYRDEFLQSNLDLLSANTLEDMSGLCQTGANATLLFDFTGLDASDTFSSGPLTYDRRAFLTEYAKFFRSRVTENISLDVDGYIVELRSRNPKRNRNYIVIQARIGGEWSAVALTINNALYEIAAKAHLETRKIRIQGAARRMKTQYKITDLLQLTVL